MDIMERIANTKVKIVVRKDGESVDNVVRLGDIFSIDETNLSVEMAKQAGLYAYFATQMAYAEYTLARASISKDEEYAEADTHYRNVLQEVGEKYTEAVIRSAVFQDEDYQTVIGAEATAKKDYRLLRVICQALEMRATMLQSLGAHLRHELDMTGMNIRKRNYQSNVGDVKKVIEDARAKRR